ncbi:hypothetical protein JCM17960_19180 [Magnetospira thiophila]
MMQPDFRTRVAEEMIRHIESGTARWQKPWTPGLVHAGPHNPVSGKAYRGINNWWLDMQARDDPRWMTFRQALGLDAQVRKGEKGTPVEYWQWTEKKPLLDATGAPVLDEAGQPRHVETRLARPRVFYATVFNAAQIDGLEPFVPPEPGFDPVARAEAVLSGGGVPINHDQNDRAFYRPMTDRIHLPARAAFDTAYEYYATALHELGHASGHKSRLNREFGPFGSGVYAIEELRAEMSAFLIGSELGLGHYPERHAGYVESWLGALKEDRNLLFRAARDAERIRDWVMEPERRPELEKAARDRTFADEKTQQEDKTMETPEQTKTEQPKTRVWLDVPYAEKDRAKAAGAKWDRRAKSWYAPDGADPEPLAAWKADPAAPKAEPSPIEEFGSMLDLHGLKLDGPPQMDGAWHRVAVEGDRKGQKSGSYRGFLDGLPNGQIVNFKLGGEIQQWIATDAQLDPGERERLKQDSQQRREVAKAERRETHRKAAARAYGVWTNAQEATSEHPYLQAKAVPGIGLKQDDRGHLLIPLRDAKGFLWNLQTIAPDGEKRFLTEGRKTGLMHVIDPRETLRQGSLILVAEGYATAASLHQATGLPCVVAFDSGNLKPVAEALRATWPEAALIIAADDDHARKVNVGLDKASEAANAVGGVAIAPAFTEAERARGLTDFNDLARERSPHVLAQQVGVAFKDRFARSARPDTDRQREAGMGL